MVRAERRATAAGRAGALFVPFLLVGACGGNPAPPAAASAPGVTRVVERTLDGDSLRLAGGGEVRLLGIDAPEFSPQPQPWAATSAANLRMLLPAGTSIELLLDRQSLDGFGRTLAHVRRASDGVIVNREQVRAGLAVTYTIWPNVARFEEYRATQIEAQDAGRGLWQRGGPSELPFEYRRRTGSRPFDRLPGDYFTRYYVDALSYERVQVNNRLFFDTESDAAGAGYLPCPQQASGYAAFCFARGR